MSGATKQDVYRQAQAARGGQDGANGRADDRRLAHAEDQDGPRSPLPGDDAGAPDQAGVDAGDAVSVVDAIGGRGPGQRSRVASDIDIDEIARLLNATMSAVTSHSFAGDRIEAYVERDHASWAIDGVRLQMRRRLGNGMAEYLRADGQLVIEARSPGAEPETGYGLVLPADALVAIGAAIDEFLGRASHHDTEVRLLREWLDVERARNDRLIGAIAEGSSE